MLKRIGIIAGYVLLWAVIIWMIVWASTLSSKHAATQQVTQTIINLSDGGEHPLIDAEAVTLWLKEQQIHPEGMLATKVDIAAIEHALQAHNAVAEANVYITHDGCVKIDITQRKPIARLRISGYDMYVTEAGYLLLAEGVKAAHVPVITGDYKPMFRSSYMGDMAAVARDSIAKLEAEITRLEEEKTPHLKALIDNNSELRKVRRSSPKKNLFTSEENYQVLVEAYKERLSKAVAAHSVNEQRIHAAIDALTKEQERVRRKCGEIERQCAEFDRLLLFLKHIGRSKEWSSEIVQIVASGGGTTPLQLAIVPRSGRFTVDLGTTENLDGKLRTLRRFYTQGLDNVGWDKYRSISLRYKGQVVCR